MRTLFTNNHPTTVLRNGGLDPILGIVDRICIVGTREVDE